MYLQSWLKGSICFFADWLVHLQKGERGSSHAEQCFRKGDYLSDRFQPQEYAAGAGQDGITTSHLH
jgi:hypothetical protein